jgi:PAS domain S-box-containing protein
MVPVSPPAEVEVDANRCYVAVNDSACELLGYTREELLTMRIDDISFPSGAHVRPMFSQFVEDGSMRGIFALRRKSGEIIWVRFQSNIVNGRSIATWTHYEVWEPSKSQIADDFGLDPLSDRPGR